MGWFVGLVGAGLVANQFPFSLFLDIDLLFGSIFAMLVLQSQGRRRGILSAALIASTTWLLWNHPYAIVVMTAEVAVAGWLMRRFALGMVQADTIYWLLLGMPLAGLFYGVVMQVPTSSLGIILMKLAVNGVFNALVARIVYTALMAGALRRLLSFRELIGNLLTAFLLVPALAMLALSSRQDFADIDQHIRTSLQRQSQSATARLSTWLERKTQVVTTLTGLASTLSPAQMQERLDQARASDNDFVRIGMRDTDSQVIAYSPAVDEQGQSNVGKKFPERPYIATLRQWLQPMLAEVVVARIGKPEPIAILLGPVLRDGQYAGYVNSVLQLERIRSELAAMADDETMYYSLLDHKGQLILSNRPGQTMMTSLARGPGQLFPLDGGLGQWVPALPANSSVFDRWKQSAYVMQTRIGAAGGWQLVLEQPLAPFQQRLYEKYARLLGLVFAAMLLALGLASVLSRRTTVTLDALSELTKDLPQRLAVGSEPIRWPRSTVLQTRQLIDNFKTMAESLERKFQEIQRINESLDRRVHERTAELARSEEKLRQLVDNSHDMIFTVDAEGRCTFMSPSWTTLLGRPVDEVLGRRLSDFVHPDDRAHTEAARRALFETGQRQTNLEYRVKHRDGSWRWHSANALPLHDDAGRVVAFEGNAKDVTEHKQVEDRVRQLAFYDALTGLPNRRMLVDRLRQTMAASKRRGLHAALLFLDLDNFKALNDTHGHGAGDLLLVTAAQRLHTVLREVDTVARFGGDEFVVLLGELAAEFEASTAKAQSVAEKIRDALAAPYVLSVAHAGQMEVEIEHTCPASIGVVVFHGQWTGEDEILQRADEAMYEAKQAGRNAIRVYTWPA